MGMAEVPMQEYRKSRSPPSNAAPHQSTCFRHDDMRGSRTPHFAVMPAFPNTIVLGADCE
jgi:hypothetical protein